MHRWAHRAIAGGCAVALVLSACGSDDGAGSGGDAAQTLVVWADNSSNTAKAIEPLCQQWAAANGVRCQVRKFNGGTDLKDALNKGNNTGDVPDVFEAPHDQIGELLRNGVLAPVVLGSKADQFEPAALAGVASSGSTYGVPWAVENVALLTNKDLSPTCPATLDDAAANAKKLLDDGTATLGIAVQIGEAGDGYHWYPLYSADGGYAFAQKPDGSFNAADMGVGKEGSIAAGERLAELGKERVIQASVSFDIAREAFATGKAPYFITGPWQIPEQTKALGDKLMVCPVPNWAGSQFTSQPFLGVRAFMRPAKAHNPVLADTFLHDAVMTTAFMDGMYQVDPRPPAWIESYDKASADPIIKAFGDYGKNGIPIPAIPDMAAVFTDLGLAEYKIASGADPTTSLDQAAESITKQNELLS